MGGESEEERKHGIKWNTRPSVVEESSSKTSPSPAPWSGGVLPRPWRLLSSWRKPSTRASWICTSVLIPRVTHICATSLRPSISEQVDGIKSIGDWIIKIKRAGDGLGLHLIDKEIGS